MRVNKKKIDQKNALEQYRFKAFSVKELVALFRIEKQHLLE